MDRRDFLRHVSAATGVGLTPALASAVLSGCMPDRAAPLTFLSAREAALVDSIAEGIIPETDTPGARAAGVVRYVDMLLAEFSSDDERLAFRERLAQTAADLGDRGAATLDDLRPADRDAFLARMESDGAFFATLKTWTLVGYYSSEVGATQELHVRPLGAWKADVPFAEVGRTWA